MAAKECCGVPQVTPFCAFCGKQLNACPPEIGLLRYIEGQLRSNKTQLASGGATNPRRKRSIEKAVQKWSDWEQFVLRSMADEVRRLVESSYGQTQGSDDEETEEVR